MVELDGVADADSLGGGIYDFLAAVVDWFPMDIIGGIAGGAASVSTLGGGSGVYTVAGDS